MDWIYLCVTGDVRKERLLFLCFKTLRLLECMPDILTVHFPLPLSIDIHSR